jgi:thiopurine S-methyltransferase
MEAEFWHNRWEENQIGWHQPDGNILLTQYFGELGRKLIKFLPVSA